MRKFLIAVSFFTRAFFIRLQKYMKFSEFQAAEIKIKAATLAAYRTMLEA